MTDLLNDANREWVKRFLDYVKVRKGVTGGRALAHIRRTLTRRGYWVAFAETIQLLIVGALTTFFLPQPYASIGIAIFGLLAMFTVASALKVMDAEYAYAIQLVASETTKQETDHQPSSSSSATPD